jgi:aldose 1-epimerase
MLHTLQNKHWQAGILPQTGASIAFGRMRYSGALVDILRPTDEEHYGNSSNCGSFIMLPWANRIRDGVLRFGDESYQLRTTKDDGTARHGDVRNRAWQVLESSETHIRCHFDSSTADDFNFPFALAAEAEYRLEDADFAWELTLTNADIRPFPAGFGHHPYFVHPAANMPLLQIPCDKQWILNKAMAESEPVPVTDRLDFRQARPVTSDTRLDDLLTDCQQDEPVKLIYQQWQTTIEMHADSIFKQVILFTAPDGTLAVEPQTNANDGFNLYARGIEEAGVFVLQPAESITGTVKLRVKSSVE